MSDSAMAKKLHSATDFGDELLRHGPYEERHIDQLLDYLKAIGVSRADWLYAPFICVEDDYPGGFNPARRFAEGARQRGITPCFVFKPDETGIGMALPPTFPRPEGVPFIEDIRGINFVVSPFTAAHPQYRMKRIPGAWNVGGPVRTIKLVKGNAATTRVRKEHLSSWTSDRSNGFTQYDGDFTLSDEIEHKLVFPRSRDFRVLTLNGLNIPEDQRCIVVKCSLADDRGDFTNETVNLLELYNDEGRLVPATPGSAPPDEKYIRRMMSQLPLTAYGQAPAVRALLNDPEQFRSHFEDYYCFDVFFHNTELSRGMLWTFDQAGFAAVARGKAEHVPGAMHPSHREVRQHWLNEVDRFLGYGFEVVSFRESNHSSTSHEREEYGFNEPVLKRATNDRRIDLDAVARYSGECYTAFLRDAAERIHGCGRRVEVHLYANYLGLEAQRAQRATTLGPFIDNQWETWVREIADGVQLRTHSGFRPTALRYIVDRFVRVAKESGDKQFVLQVRSKGTQSEYARKFLRWNMEFVKSHPCIDAFLLYETANFTKRDEDGGIVGYPEMTRLVQRSWRGASQVSGKRKGRVR